LRRPSLRLRRLLSKTMQKRKKSRRLRSPNLTMSPSPIPTMSSRNQKNLQIPKLKIPRRNPIRMMSRRPSLRQSSRKILEVRKNPIPGMKKKLRAKSKANLPLKRKSKVLMIRRRTRSNHNSAVIRETLQDYMGVSRGRLYGIYIELSR
jgi:hypothetical protein